MSSGTSPRRRRRSSVPAITAVTTGSIIRSLTADAIATPVAVRSRPASCEAARSKSRNQPTWKATAIAAKAIRASVAVTTWPRRFVLICITMNLYRLLEIAAVLLAILYVLPVVQLRVQLRSPGTPHLLPIAREQVAQPLGKLMGGLV